MFLTVHIPKHRLIPKICFGFISFMKSYDHWADQPWHLKQSYLGCGHQELSSKQRPWSFFFAHSSNYVQYDWYILLLPWTTSCTDKCLFVPKMSFTKTVLSSKLILLWALDSITCAALVGGVLSSKYIIQFRLFFFFFFFMSGQFQ